MAPWNDRAQVLECVAILPETASTRTFCFQTSDQNWFRYLPGQFLTLEIPTVAGTVHRTYTISSSPSRPMSIAITAKMHDDSIGTRSLFENMAVGDRVRAFGPAGFFSCHTWPADKYLFISAGSGVTPMMSMTRWLYDQGRHCDVAFIHAARRPSEIIFREELERMAARVPSFSLAWVVSEPDRFSVWTGYRGRLNGLMLELMAPDYFEREIFCCGPQAFMQAVRDVLNAGGFDMEHYHEESFQAPVVEPSDAVPADDVIPDETRKARIRFALSDMEVSCSETDTILGVAKGIGLNIPSGCQHGVCGTCRVRCLSGQTHMAA